ncbi:hypothetical protein Tco_0481214 [Tanacetum coccineum]
MLSASKLPLSFWAEAVATACYTQNRSIIISTHGKTAYHIINDRKPSIKHLHIFGCICYITRDGENLDKMKEKGDPWWDILLSQRDIISDLAPQRQEMSVENVSLGLVPQGQKVPLLEEYYNPTHGLAEENNNDQAPNASFHQDDFFNPFCTRVQEIGESSVQEIEIHPLDQVSWKSNHASSNKTTACNTDPEMCMFALTVSIVDTKNIKDGNRLISEWTGSNYRLKFISSTRLKYGKGTSQQTIWQDDYKVMLRVLDFEESFVSCSLDAVQIFVDPLAAHKSFQIYLMHFSSFSCRVHFDTEKALLEGYRFLGDKLVSWMSKKQNCTAMSSAEAEYVTLSASCAQVMWMRNTLSRLWLQLQQNTFVLRISSQPIA